MNVELARSNPGPAAEGGESSPAPDRHHAPLEWTVDPWKQNRWRPWLMLLSLGLVQRALQGAGIPVMAQVVLFAAFAIVLAPAYMIQRCRVDETGVARRMWRFWDTRPWDRIRRAQVGSLGLAVFTNARPGALDSFRSLWLPLPVGDRSGNRHAHLLSELKRRVHEHGLQA